MEKIRAEQQTSSTTLQTLSNSIHSREMDLAKKKQELKDKDALEQTQKDAREEIIKLETQTKVRTSPPASAQPPADTQPPPSRTSTRNSATLLRPFVLPKASCRP